MHFIMPLNLVIAKWKEPDLRYLFTWVAIILLKMFAIVRSGKNHSILVMVEHCQTVYESDFCTVEPV